MRMTLVRNVAAAVLAGGLVLSACSDDDAAVDTPVGTEQTEVGENSQGGAAQDSLEGRLGEDVELTGEVAEVLSPNAFTLGGDEIGENPILVVGAEVPTGLAAGGSVTVSGTVTEFQVAGYEEDLDLDLDLDLVDDEFEDFDGDPAIQADSVVRT